MLTPQQAAAKEAAHDLFEYAVRLEGRELGLADEHLDVLPRFVPGIAGIGIAEDVLRLYVLADPEPDVDIPEQISQLNVQIVETTGFTPLPLPRQSHIRPAPAGVSISHERPSAGTGTLGCLVDTPDGRRCILSNNHVLADTNAVRNGPIIQPGRVDLAGRAPSRIATLTDFEVIHFGSATNSIDAAIACLDDSSDALPTIMTLGAPANPPVTAALHQAVTKHGRTTGLTFGTVVDISFDGVISYDGRPAYFENQIVVQGTSGPFSEPGDSGSLILASPGSHPVGLLFAGDDSLTLANPIQSVLNRFGATVAIA